MKEGLLWFDDDPTCSLEDKVARAARRYREKFGVAPDTCCVHPSAVNGKATANGISIVPSPSVLRHHFWIGVVTKCSSSMSGRVATQLSFMEEEQL